MVSPKVLNMLQVCFFFFFFLFVFFFKQIGSTNHISESLGAVIDPDMSWSSSLNTPRTVTPTVLIQHCDRVFKFAYYNFFFFIECRVDCCGTNPVIVHNNQKQNDSFLAPDTSCQNITVSSDSMEKYPVMTDKLKDSKELPPYASEQSATNHTTDIVPSIDVCVLPHKKTMSRTAQFCKAKRSRSESEEYLEGRLSSDSDHKSKKKRKNSEEGYCSSSEESYLKKVIPDDKLSNHTYKESSECLATAPSKIPSFTDSLHDTGFKTASNNTIKVYSASFDKAQSMFEETEDLYLKDQHLQKSSLCLKRCSEKEFSKSFSEADKMWCSSKLPSSNNVFLTPSQKAEVYELCSFLEEAGTQFELTQTEKTKSKSNNCNSLHSTGDQETIPSTPNVSDILNGINFDDSFNAENNTSLNTKPAMDLMMTIDSHEESCEKVCTSIQSAKTVNSLYLGKKGNDLSFSAQGKEPNGGSDVEKGVNTSTQDSVGAVTHLEGIDFHKRLLKEGEMNTETENERHIIKQQLMCPSPAENGDIASYTMVRESSNNTESREMKENNVIKGFYTASGKKLNISKNAMESATSIFEDLCPEKNWTCSYLSKSLNTSDTSESQPAKHFSVPRKVVNRSFKEVSQTNKNECKPSYFPGVTVCIQNETQLNPNLAFSSNKDHSENKDQSSSVGFMSANKSFKNSNNKFMSVQGLCGLESFQTASGNVITYGQESLAKGLTLFSEEDDFSPYGDKKCSDKCDFQFENEHNSADTGIHVSKGDFGNLMDVSSSCLVSHCHKRKTDSNLPKLNDDASKRAKEMFKDSGNLNDELLTDVCLIVADGVKHHCTKPRLNDSLSSEVGELGNVQCPVSKRNFDITQVNLLNTSNNGRDGPNVSLPIDMVIFSSENRKSLQHMNSKYGTCDMTLSCGLLCNKSLIQDDLPMQHDSFVSDNSDSDGNKVGVSCVGLGTEHNVSYQKPYMLGENYTYEDSTKRANNIVTDTTAHCENFQTTAFCKNGNQNLTSEQVLKKKGTFSNIDKTLAPSVSAVSTTSRFLLHSDSEKKVCFSKTVFCEEEALLRGPDEANRIKKDIRCDAENMKQSGMPHSKCARNVAGFSTANGKTIFFSEEAFCKAKALLNDCEDRNSQICATEVMKAPHLPLENCAKNVVGFSTTKSKSFDMVNMKVPCPPVVNYKPESAAGFNTASGKRITITEKALEDTKALFNNCDEETNDRMISSGSESTESPGLLFKNCVPSSASGFTTASGKRVQFSEKAFSEATALLKDCVDTTSEKSASSDSESLHHLVNHYTKNIQRLNVARGKMLSEKASDDTKTLLNYSKDETNEKKSISDFENTKVPDLYPPSCNSRNFARVALHHSKKSLKDGEDERKKNISKSGNGLIKSKLLFADCIKNNTGFTTVSGNKFVISESALHDSKALLNEYVNEVTEEHTNSDMVHQQAPILPHVNCITESAAGFTTASGKKVLITEKALHDAEVFFKDCDSERNEKMIGSGAEFSKVPGFSHVNSGFRTASGKNVLFSEKLYTFGVRRPTIHAYYKYAASFRFKFTDYFSKDAVLTSHGAQLADGGWLISDDSGTAGKEEFYRALCDTPGVDPKLITENWVYNHYSLIIWKLAAMETAFPNVFGGCCLTPERVLLQLKYRYDVEIDRCQRSAIKKITERDDSPAKTLILCISKIIANGSQPYPNIKNNTCTTSADKKKQLPTGVIEVTDGWYLIKAHLDARLTALLQSGKLSVGNKIVTNGAELIGCQDACTPLEAPESLMLKISANSTRPARWYCKLGFYCDPRPFVLPLSSLFYDGGIVGCVDVIILRSYSLQWMEKRPNGVFLFRNERAEVREAKRQEDSHQKNMEELFARVQAEFEKDLECIKGKSKVKLNIQQIQALQDGAELYEAFESSTDPGFLETCLSAQQVAVLNRHKQAVNDQKQAKLQEKFRKILESSQEENSCTKRDVTPVWKLHIVDYKDLDKKEMYMLNVWRPTVDLCSLLKEGDRYKIYHLAASQPKGRMGSTSVQLTVTKKTQFQQLQVSPDHLTLLYKCREAVNFRSLSNPTFQPPCEEVDLVGLVICIEGGAAVVYLCDEELNFVALKTWSSLNHLAADDIIMPMTLLAASNLHFKYNSSVAIPVVYGGDLATFSGNPKEKHLHSAIEHLKKNIQVKSFFFLITCFKNHHAQTYARHGFQLSHSLSQATLEQETASEASRLWTAAEWSKVMFSDENEESDRKSIKKKKALDFLSRIPSPPPLTPLKNIVSDSLKKGFHPPRKQTFTPETRKEETSDKSQAVLCNKPVSSNHFPEDQWVNDEELAMINTQALLGCLQEDWSLGEAMQNKFRVMPERFW
uniref:Tower domain-containing protein n=1 Tax=Erpetoichthys calabaricus TaxID=27687 RepID=A0A8C4RQH5_ERPCA